MNGTINESINIEHTLYTIYLRLDRDETIKTGKLGEYFFQKGTYIFRKELTFM
jgi:hypothetical protein